MEYGLTVSVQKRMKIENKLPKGEEKDYRFCWELNYTKIQNKNTLLIVHASSRYCIVYANIKPSFWKDIKTGIREAVFDAFLREGFSEDETEKYLHMAGDEKLTQTHGRQIIGGLNHITSMLPYFDCWFEEGMLQHDYTNALNNEIISSAVHPEYMCFNPDDYFRNEIRNLLYGEEMKLRFAILKGGIIIRDGIVEERTRK